MDDDGRSDLVQRLFHLLALEAEALGAIALEGQAGEIGYAHRHELAARARDIGEKIQITAEAAAALI